MKNINKPYSIEPEWNVAGLFQFDEEYFKLFHCLKDNNIHNPIKYIYGSPNVCMEGGRHIHKDEEDITKNCDIMRHYIDLGLNLKLTFSNHLITPDQYTDPDLNIYLVFLNQYKGNGVIVSDDLFAKYIKDTYPNLLVISSVIKPAVEVGWGNETAEYYNNLFDLYDIVVINTGKVLEKNFIEKLKYPERLEVLVNSRCLLNCPLAKQHYDLVAQITKLDTSDIISKSELKRLEDESKQLWDICLENHQQNPLAGSNLTTTEIQQLIDKNITRFKLEGRNWQNGVLLRDFGDYIFQQDKIIRIYKTLFGEAV